MIECLIGTSALHFIDYGCYCGMGGQGKPVDSIDKLVYFKFNSIGSCSSNNGNDNNDNNNINSTLGFLWYSRVTFCGTNNLGIPVVLKGDLL